MKMGIERVLKEKFGDAVQDIRQLSFEEPKETTVEASPILQYPFFIFSFFVLNLFDYCNSNLILAVVEM
jgi:hypothetical protein